MISDQPIYNINEVLREQIKSRISAYSVVLECIDRAIAEDTPMSVLRDTFASIIQSLESEAKQ